MLAFVLSFWGDDWMDKEAKSMAVARCTTATRCPVCQTALLLNESTMRWSCPRCRMGVVSFETPTSPSPPNDRVRGTGKD